MFTNRSRIAWPLVALCAFAVHCSTVWISVGRLQAQEAPLPAVVEPPVDLSTESDPAAASDDPAIAPPVFTLDPTEDGNDPSNPLAADPALAPIVDPAAVAADPVSDGAGLPPTAADAEEASSKLVAKMVLIETDWTKAKDSAAAEKLANTISGRLLGLDDVWSRLFPPGYSAVFDRHEGRAVAEEIQKLGLVRQTLSARPLDLELDVPDVEALGGVVVAFSKRGSDGVRRSVEWNLLVLAQPMRADDSGEEETTDPQTYSVAIVGWRARTAEERQADSGGEGSFEFDDLERYVGAFELRTDQSAIVPLALPGVEGLTVVVSAPHQGTIVRSLGPQAYQVAREALSSEMSIDWNSLIRAYEASPIGKASVTAADAAEEASPANRETITLHWRPASEDQFELVEQAVAKAFPQLRILSRQLQGDQGASVAFAAPAEAAEDIERFAVDVERTVIPILPEGATLQVAISKGPSEQQREASEEQAAEAERTTMIFRLEHSASDEVAKLLEALKLDPAIRVVSDRRTNSILLSAPDATKHKHVQAAIDLLKELDRPAEAKSAAERGASSSQPDRSANVEKLRSELALVEADVQTGAANARAASSQERQGKIDDLRRVVALAFDLRLKLQREEAAELRDRLAKIEDNLTRRERIEGAVIDRRIEVLLDPALEWPEVAEDQAVPSRAVAGSAPSADVSSISAEAPPFDLAAVTTLEGFSGSDRRGDAFAAATSLAREINELNHQAETLPAANPPEGSEVRLALIRRQLELLRQEFDAREQALKLELEAARAKLNGVQASYERIRTLFDTGAASIEEVQKTEAELQVARSDAARLEVLLQQYDRARASLPSGFGVSAGSETRSSNDELDRLPARIARNLSERRHTNDPLTFPVRLQGIWLQRKEILYGETRSSEPPPRWIILRDMLIIEREGRTPVRHSLWFTPGEDIPLEIMRYTAPAMGKRFSVRYEGGGPGLRVMLVPIPGGDGPKEIGPSEGVEYFELEFVPSGPGQFPSAEADDSSDDASQARPAETPSTKADSAEVGTPADIPTPVLGVPSEILGVWRLKQHVVKSAPEAKAVFSTWTLDDETLVADVSVRPGGDRYVTVFPADEPGTFQTYEYTENLDGRVLGQRVQSVRFEVEGDTLRAAFSDSDAAPEKVAPAEGVVYFEFERDKVGPDDELIPVRSEEAAASERGLVKQAREIAEALKAKEQAIQEQKAHYASISKADATAPGVEKTIEIYESEAEVLRERLREMEFFVERMSAGAQERAEAAESEDDKRQMEEEAVRLGEIAKSVIQVALSAGVEKKPDWLPAVISDHWEPWKGHGELHQDYRRARENQKNLKPNSDDYRLAQDRIEWIIRTAKNARSRIAISEGMRRTALTQAQDGYFAAEKHLTKTRSRDATRDELEAAAFELARAAYVVERTRQILDAVAKREAELDNLFREIVSDEKPLNLDEATAPASGSPPGPVYSPSPRSTPADSEAPTDAAEEALSP